MSEIVSIIKASEIRKAAGSERLCSYPIHSSTGGRFVGLVTRGDERSHSNSSIW